MTMFAVGEAVSIPCTVQRGAFQGEHLVTVEIMDGVVSGFARDHDLAGSNDALQAIVQSISGDRLSVKLSGSFFTTNGLVDLSLEWAKKNVRTFA